MSFWKSLTGAAGSVLLTCGSGVFAADPTPVSDNSNLTLHQPVLLQNTAESNAPPRGLLMSGLDQVGAGQFLDKLGINLYGYIEGSYTYNFDNPSSKINTFRTFDFQDQALLMDQLELTVERAVDYRTRRFDIGFRMDWMYGADAGIIHSNGLFDYYRGVRSPQNQVDLTQAYLDIDLPIGTGLRIRAGKFVNFVGYETVEPTVDPSNSGVVDFYSRGLIFFQYPFTHTGIIATYDVAKNVTVTAGISRGDNQSVDDNNDSISFLGSVNWVINKSFSFYLSNSTGPEKNDNTRDIRTTWDATLFYTPTKAFTAALNAYYVWEQNGSVFGGNANFYAVGGYAAYQLNEVLTLKGRVEWVHDEDGFRLGTGVDNIYEGTIGLSVRPFPGNALGRNLKIRPEVRWDYSPDSPFNGRNNQVTAAVDVVVTF